MQDCRVCKYYGGLSVWKDKDYCRYYKEWHEFPLPMDCQWFSPGGTYYLDGLLGVTVGFFVD